MLGLLTHTTATKRDSARNLELNLARRREEIKEEQKNKTEEKHDTETDGLDSARDTGTEAQV